MNKLIYALILILLLSMAVLNGCGGGIFPPPSPMPTLTPVPSPTPTVLTSMMLLNVYDKSTLQPLSGASLSIMDIGLNNTITGSSYPITLNNGSYTVYLSMAGYITRGFVFNLTSNLTFNVYLSPQNVNENKEEVSGTFLMENGDQPGYCNIYAGNQYNASHYENTENPFTISAVSGNIMVSAYTKMGNNGEDIDKIKYAKTDLRTNLVLELPSEPISYYGFKPASDLLIVKQNEGYFLARQESSSTFYTFGVNPVAGDKIIIESYKNDNDKYYFTRVDAGNTGGPHSIYHQSEIPSFTITSDENNYIVNINPVSFATHYEVYAIQVKTDGVGNPLEERVPFRSIVLNESKVKAPKNLFSSGFDSTFIYLRAIYLQGFNINNIINETQIYDNYSYIDKEQSLNLGPLSLYSKNANSFKTNKEINDKIRSKLNLNYLCSE